MEQKPLQVLATLLAHAGEVVTKRELFEQVWAGRVTVDHVLATAVGKLRKALGDDGESYIVTVPRVGYRLTGDVERTVVGRRHISALALKAGDPVPQRELFTLERPLGHTHGSEVWLASHRHNHALRVFKFSQNGEQLDALKREVTLSRLLQDSAATPNSFARVIDWNFEQPPFFIECEYGGQDLAAWTASGKLADCSTEQRLALFSRICAATAAAHAVGVLHKDLKPTNVLIDDSADPPCIRLTDFGIGRLLDPDRLSALGVTAMGLTQTIGIDSASGTPLYLAPELLAGQSPSIRSDIYALGVMLYQIQVDDLKRPMAPGWERDIADPLLCADIARATDGDPARRFASVDALIDHLRDLGPRREATKHASEQAERTQQLQQALARARTRRPWIAALTVSLLIGVVVSLGLYLRAEHARRIAEQETLRAEAVVAFLTDDLLGGANPGTAGFEKNPTARELLDAATLKLQGRFAEAPATRAGVLDALGNAYYSIGNRDQGSPYLREAASLYTTLFGEGDSRTLLTRYRLVRSLAYHGTAEAYSEAAETLAQADAAAGNDLGAAPALALQAALARFDLHFQQLQISPALAALRSAHALAQQVAPDDAYQLFSIRFRIADCLLRLGQHEAALAEGMALGSSAEATSASVGAGLHANLDLVLARSLRSLGRHDEALQHAERARDIVEAVYGMQDYTSIIAASTVASIHDAAGRCSQALPIQRSVYERMRERNGDASKATLYELGNLGLKEHACGDRIAALALIAEAETGLRDTFGENDAGAQSFRYFLVTAKMEAFDFAGALEMLDGLDAQILAAGDSAPAWPQRLEAMRGLILVSQGEIAEGQALLAPALSVLRQHDADADIERYEAALARPAP